MSNKLTQYSSEFKESAIKLALDESKPIAQTAVDLGIKKSTLYTWINKHAGPRVIVSKANDNEHIYDENKRLKKELARVTQERDLLKKAAAYFSKESLVKVRLDKRASNRVFGASYSNHFIVHPIWNIP